MSNQPMLRLAFEMVETILVAKAKEEFGEAASIGTWSYESAYDHFVIQVDVPGEMYYKEMSCNEDEILGEKSPNPDWP